MLATCLRPHRIAVSFLVHRSRSRDGWLSTLPPTNSPQIHQAGDKSDHTHSHSTWHSGPLLRLDSAPRDSDPFGHTSALSPTGWAHGSTGPFTRCPKRASCEIDAWLLFVGNQHQTTKRAGPDPLGSLRHLGGFVLMDLGYSSKQDCLEPGNIIRERHAPFYLIN